MSPPLQAAKRRTYVTTKTTRRVLATMVEVVVTLAMVRPRTFDLDPGK
jgi:hypothetical protein